MFWTESLDSGLGLFTVRARVQPWLRDVAKIKAEPRFERRSGETRAGTSTMSGMGEARRETELNVVCR